MNGWGVTRIIIILLSVGAPHDFFRGSAQCPLPPELGSHARILEECMCATYAAMGTKSTIGDEWAGRLRNWLLVLCFQRHESTLH